MECAGEGSEWFGPGSCWHRGIGLREWKAVERGLDFVMSGCEGPVPSSAIGGVVMGKWGWFGKLVTGTKTPGGVVHLKVPSAYSTYINVNESPNNRSIPPELASMTLILISLLALIEPKPAKKNSRKINLNKPIPSSPFSSPPFLLFS